MAAPTLISYNDATADWTTGSAGGSKSTASISWQTGDVIVVIAGAEGINTLGTPTATGLTFTKNVNNTTASTCEGFAATAVAASASSGAVTVTSSSTSQHWGFGVWVWRSSTGVGNSAEQHTTTKTKALTATAADGGICWGVFDFGAGTLDTITPTPTNTRQRVNNGSNYTYYVADLTDQTSAGSVSYGLVTGGSGAYTIVIQEVKNTGAGGATITYPMLERGIRGLQRGLITGGVH